MAYNCCMTEIASRELRNDTAGLLRRAQGGEDITVTISGKPVAVLTKLQSARRRWVKRDEILQRLRHAQADPQLRDDLVILAGETTDDELGPGL